MDIFSNFAVNIKNLRKRDHLTQKALAQKINYSEKAIAKWESGTALPSVDTLYVLSELFNVTIDYLISKHSDLYFLGIHGTVSETNFALANKSGSKIKHSSSVGTNLNDESFSKNLDSLIKSTKEFCAGIPLSSIVTFIGIAGMTFAFKEKIIEAFTNLGFKKVYAGGDIDDALFAGLGNDDGIVAYAGTGMQIVRRKKGSECIFGGWGYLIDGGGSGFNIGQEGLRYYFKKCDGLVDPSILTDIISEHANTVANRTFCSSLYNDGKKFIASFAKDVFAAASKGDAVSELIIKENAKALAELAIRATDSFDKDVKIAFCGWVYENNLFKDHFIKILNDKGYTNVSPVSVPMVDGALKKAKFLFDKEIDNHEK